MWRDAAGTVNQRAADPARIVSLVPSITELICDLGLSAQLVGRTGFCVHPRVTLVQDADLVLLSSEPYRFRDHDLAELRALPVMRGKTVALIDGEATSWYGSRAIAGLDFLRRFRQKPTGRDAMANPPGNLR